MNKKEILKRDGYKCLFQQKGCWKTYDLHHIIKKSQGGGNESDNLITLCRKCHREFHDGKIQLDDLLEAVNEHFEDIGLKTRFRRGNKKTFKYYE